MALEKQLIISGTEGLFSSPELPLGPEEIDQSIQDEEGVLTELRAPFEIFEYRHEGHAPYSHTFLERARKRYPHFFSDPEKWRLCEIFNIFLIRNQ